MVTTKIRSDFTTSIVNSLLFLSMQNTTEMYLPEEIKGKSKTANGRVSNLKDTISKSIDKKVRSLFRKNTKDSRSLDNEIEIAMGNIKNPEQENVNSLLAKEENSDFLHEMAGYQGKKKTTKDAIESSLKDLYSSFVSYAKKTYNSIGSKTKKIDGFVKLTLYKIIRLGEYVMALTTPQWNRVMGSFEDRDTLAPTMSQKESISEENAKYETGYNSLRYR